MSARSAVAKHGKRVGLEIVGWTLVAAGIAVFAPNIRGSSGFGRAFVRADDVHGRRDAFDDVIEDFVDNFLRPGNLQGGFDWYLSQNEGRLAMIRGEAPAPKPIAVPTCIRWGDSSPLFPYAWTDRLGETFSNLDLAPFEGAGHFPHRERPEEAAAAIAAFFGRLEA